MLRLATIDDVLEPLPTDHIYENINNSKTSLLLSKNYAPQLKSTNADINKIAADVHVSYDIAKEYYFKTNDINLAKIQILNDNIPRHIFINIVPNGELYRVLNERRQGDVFIGNHKFSKEDIIYHNKSGNSIVLNVLPNYLIVLSPSKRLGYSKMMVPKHECFYINKSIITL